MTTDLSSWFVRWLLSYPLKYIIMTLTFKLELENVAISHKMVALVNGAIVAFGTTACAVTMNDWWGLANATAMTVSVLVPNAILQESRDALDCAVTESTPANKEDGVTDEMVKVFLTTPSRKAVTIHAPRLIVINALVNNNDPRQPSLHVFLRSIGWLAFGAHHISLGMSLCSTRSSRWPSYASAPSSQSMASATTQISSALSFGSRYPRQHLRTSAQQHMLHLRSPRQKKTPYCNGTFSMRK